MAKKKIECPPPPPVWLTSWGDMTTLMLTFFVLLIGTPKQDQEFRLILSAFTGSLGLFEGGQTLSKGKLEQMGMTLESLPSTEQGRSFSKAYKIATEVFKPEVKAKKVTIVQDERGLVISLVGQDHFAPGSARLTDEAKRILSKVSDLLRTLNSFVRIEGHADETPVVAGPANERYETNWELSAIRATNVLRYLNENGDVEPEKMSAVAFGKYRPISESDNPEGRALNRRVDIVVLPGKNSTRGYPDSELPGKKVPGTEWDNK